MADITGIGELQASLRQLQSTVGACIPRAMSRCGLLAVREAKANAPRSPTMKQLSSTLKRKKRTKQRTYPGGLEKSIEYEVFGDVASVFVSSNSYAGKYAKRIHDEKGQTWRNRGPGTIAKGSRADDKFIERAINSNVEKFKSIIENEIAKAIRSAK